MKSCIFVSAGDRERFASFATQKMREDFDIFINYYGEDEERMETLRGLSSGFSCIKSTKFISLKESYDRFIRGRYEWVAVFDDDAEFVLGSMNDLVAAGDEFGLEIVSGSHTGKVSHPRIHRRTEGDHKIRYVNFIEMNFPVFRNKSLAKYMDIYDRSLCGWGNDWWYCGVLETSRKKNAGVVDSVCIENPVGRGEMNMFMDWHKRQEEWNMFKDRVGFVEWERDTIGFA